ncbi:MAG: RluA family pseudouridine synthase [Deltaproteobacteria bacterium]|nr:RluA family pseudouridine synthase [Deltaproteobacteria bacterium]
MVVNGTFTILVDESDQDRRLDAVVAAHLPACSRSLAANLIANHKILVDNQPKKPGYRVRSGQEIIGRIPAPEPVEYKPESIPLDILYQDRYIVVLNKPAGLVVHPAPGHRSGTLVNALLYHCPDLGGIGGEIRPGIVHRLDKDTSGTMVVAKNAQALEILAQQFKTRTVRKKYLALVYGDLKNDEGTINLPIGRHPVHRKQMSTTTRKGRSAETSWRVREKFKAITLLELTLKTGRTHQIRVHCTALGHPIVGDQVYRSRKWLKDIDRLFSGESSSMVAQLKAVSRQMLHAWRLRLTHPYTGEIMTFESPIPTDMETVIEKLRRTR